MIADTMRIIYNLKFYLCLQIFAVFYNHSNVCTTFGNHDSFNYLNRLHLTKMLRDFS